MSIPRPHSRGAPSSSSRPHSTHSSHSQSDAYIPPTTSQGESDFDFCNSFWVTPSTRNGSEERDWGREGYECLMTRVKSGGKVLEDLRSVLKERASIEEDYAKRLNKLSKSSFGTGETGHMERAMLTLKGELEQTSKSHHDLASLLRMQDSLVSDFTQKREGARKTSGIEKTWKSMNNQREHVLKAKTKYENDAIQINSLHAQASLLQGRDLDKATLKMDKVQQTVVVNERDYKNFVNVLKETTVNWNMAWKTFCDLVQDQEEERLEFVKGRMWDWANAQSTIAMAEDESAERTRTALEQCEPKLDIRIFVQRFATGNCIPDPLPFVDAARTTPHPKQSYKTAKFSRSSTRIPGVKHSPSAVNDIARALHQQTSSTPLSVAPQTNSARPPPSSSTSTSAIPQQQHSRGASSNSLGANGIPRPASRGANLYAESTSQTFSPSQETTPTRPVPNDSAPSSTSRFAVSPSAASLRQPPPSSDPRAVSPTPARPGHINAAAFQNRPSAIVPTQPPQSVPPPAQYQASPASSPKKPSSFPSPYTAQSQNQSGGGGGDDENDPLLQALKVLQSTPAPAASPRSSRMSPYPQSTSSQSSSTPAPAPGRPLSSMGQRPNHRSQSSLGQNLPPAVGMGGGRSRPTSPAPQAAMMQPPSSSSVTGSNQTQASYGQAFPGERAQQQIARPHSRAGSNVSQQQQPNRNSLASPASVGNFQARPSSPGGGGGGGFAGVGSATARGRSPSPQPFIPESLRPRSPAIQQQIHAQQQQQQRPTSAYGNHAQAPPPPSNQYSNQNQNHYGGAPQGYPTSQSHPYAQPPPAQSNPYARATSPAPQQQQVGRPNSIVNYAPPPPQSQQPHPYSSQSQQFSNSPSSHLSQQQQPSPYSGTTPSTQPSQSYPYPSQTPSHSHSHSQGQHSTYAPPPQQQYAPPPPPSSVISQTSIQRTPSLHSGVSSVPPPSSHQSYARPQQQARAPSVASVRAGSTAPPPPTGQYTDQGVPIIFYVNALFDYRATSNEEFSFSQGDVIAVTATDPDGWWQGQRVGDTGNSKLFPSNFTELLS